MRKELRFIHIPQNAGTSIEEAGRVAKQCWGKYDLDLAKKPRLINKSGPYWHANLCEFPEKVLSQLKEEFCWFAVVRNPIDRVRSEFNCKYGNRMSHKQSFLNFNFVLFKHFIRILSRRGSLIPYGHWLPCSLYTHYKGKQWVDHILRFSALESEFSALMDQYEIHCELGHHNKSLDNKRKIPLTCINHLLIRLVYRDDYKYLSDYWL